MKKQFDKEPPEWAKLVGIWKRDRGSNGLTLPFLCVATGIQPEQLLSEVWEIGGKISYCYGICANLITYRAPRVRWQSEMGWEECDRKKRALPIWPPVGREAKPFPVYNIKPMLKYLELPYSPSEPMEYYLGILMSETTSLILSGYETRRHSGYPNYSNSWLTYDEADKKFILETLGHPSYKVVGLTKEGEIEYAAPWKRAKSQGPVLSPQYS